MLSSSFDTLLQHTTYASLLAHHSSMASRPCAILSSAMVEDQVLIALMASTVIPSIYRLCSFCNAHTTLAAVLSCIYDRYGSFIPSLIRPWLIFPNQYLHSLLLFDIYDTPSTNTSPLTHSVACLPLSSTLLSLILLFHPYWVVDFRPEHSGLMPCFPCFLDHLVLPLLGSLIPEWP
jgi:hypothetical protein